MNKGYCIICGKTILPGEPALFSKPKRGKTKWFHTKCMNAEKGNKQNDNKSNQG